MKRRSEGLSIFSAVYLRIALRLSFISAVADRFGWWGAFGQPNVAWVPFAKNKIAGLDDGKTLNDSSWECPSCSPSSAPCVPRSRRTRIWHSRTWRSANNSPYSAIARGDLGSVSSTAPSGCGSLNAGQFGEERFTSSAPKRSYAGIGRGFAHSGPGSANARARVVHFNVTETPTAAWTAQQIVEAFPDDSAPRYLLRDRDGAYGELFRQRVRGIGFVEVLTAPRSPWQNPFAERVIGTIRRELLDHVIVLSEGHLRRRLRSYLRYYHDSRTHLALEKDAPEPRAVEPPEHGRVVALPHVGGLHHRYVRRAA